MIKSIVITFVTFVTFVVTAFPSTNLPPASSALVSVNATTLQFRAAGILESNAIARVNQPVTIADLTFTTNTWWQSDTNVWTNAAGWVCSGIMTNGVLDCNTNAIISPIIAGPGLSSVAVIWTNFYLMTEIIEWSTNGSTWTELDDPSDLRESWPVYQVRIRAYSPMGVPNETPTANIAHITVTGHRHPALIGSTNDYAGIVIRVDNPVGNRDAVNLQTLNTRLAAVELIAPPSSWSSYGAATPVNLNGQSLTFDPRYTLAISNDTLTLSFSGQPIWDVVGGGPVTPQIMSFSIDSLTNVSIRVTGAAGWRPYPEWCGDLLVGSWTRLATNEFTSSYPAISNGQYLLNFTAVTNSPAYYRTVAIDETGGTNTLALEIRVPLLVDGPVSGTGMANYATTSALAEAVARLVPSNALGGLVMGIVETNYIERGNVHLGLSATAENDGVAVGSGATATTNAVAIGAGASAAFRSTALGENSTAAAEESTALGRWVNTTGYRSTGAGSQVRARGTNCVAIGYGVLVSNMNAIAIGPWSRAVGDAGLAIGNRADVEAAGAIQLGEGTNTAAGSFQVGPYTLLDNSGKIPTLRFTGWSGVWTNIMDGITNLLQFGNGIATNQVTL